MDESCPRRRARSRTPATSSRIRQVAGSRESGTRRSHANTGMWTCLWARMRANMTRGAAIRAHGNRHGCRHCHSRRATQGVGWSAHVVRSGRSSRR